MGVGFVASCSDGARIPRSCVWVAVGEAVGDGACTWQQLRVVKTIDTRSCLLKNQALMKSIETWAKWLLPMCTLLHKCTPPTAMAKAISAAFSSDDVAKGGCLPL